MHDPQDMSRVLIDEDGSFWEQDPLTGELKPFNPRTWTIDIFDRKMLVLTSCGMGLLIFILMLLEFGSDPTTPLEDTIRNTAIVGGVTTIATAATLSTYNSFRKKSKFAATLAPFALILLLLVILYLVGWLKLNP